MSRIRLNRIEKARVIGFATQMIVTIKGATERKIPPDAEDLETVSKTVDELAEFGLIACSRMLDDAMVKWSGLLLDA